MTALSPTVEERVPPQSAVDLIAPGALPPEDLDPLADGVLMKHQADWVADQSPLKLAEKGRRTGFTFAEALDSTLIAAAKRSAGGDSTWYIGDTKEKGLEFIAVCARFARHVAKELLEVEEFLFEDRQPDGSSKYINAYRIRFASGFQVAALASRPATIRGLQGRVVIDEAAFHMDVQGVIDACNALLIWGGVIRIISTHNGVLNAFNDLIKDTRAGLYDYRIHHATFDDAVTNGLYERVCLIKGWEPTPEGKAEWYRRVLRSYGSRTEARQEELFAEPREGEGVAIPLAWIEACSTPEYTVARWSPPAEDFVDWPEERRRGEMAAWLAEHVDPVLESLPPLPVCLGGDFGMRVDRSCFPIGYTGQDLTRHVPLLIELARCPYDQQRQVLFHLHGKLRRFQRGILDANGNGMALAQEARQKFGAERIVELMANDAWYRENSPPLRTAFQDRTIKIPADLDLRNDIRELRTINGVIKVPAEIRKAGTDGDKRHGDGAVSLLNFYTATRSDAVEYGYAAVPRHRPRVDDRGGRDDDEGGTFADRGADRMADIRGAW